MICLCKILHWNDVICRNKYETVSAENIRLHYNHLHVIDSDLVNVASDPHGLGANVVVDPHGPG